jgi:hypothetical protein
MTRSLLTTNLGASYNAFLFASIPDEGGAAPLNTVSVFARHDIDPWREAAELSRLPRDSAIRRLAALLARMPGRPGGLPDAERIAVRLLTLLPLQTSSGDAVSPRDASRVQAFNPTSIAICLGFTVIVLMSGFFQAHNFQKAALIDGNPRVASDATLPAGSHPTNRR